MFFIDAFKCCFRCFQMLFLMLSNVVFDAFNALLHVRSGLSIQSVEIERLKIAKENKQFEESKT